MVFCKSYVFKDIFSNPYCECFYKESSDESMNEKGFTDEQQNEIRTYRAEARFMRALSYYHAMDLFGNVPFVDETDPIGVFTPEQIYKI